MQKKELVRSTVNSLLYHPKKMLWNLSNLCSISFWLDYARIAGGYLIWLWLREDKSFWFGCAGGLLLTLYGIIPTLQPANFGRVYAAYGGVFIFLSLLWGWQVDKTAPDKFDIIGALIAIAGVFVIMYFPRR